MRRSKKNMDEKENKKNYYNLLSDRLLEYSKTNSYPFHMPGHKRNKKEMPDWNFFQMDITEIDGFDNLHHADGILRESMERAAEVFYAEKSYFLVNGSTGGILSAIFAVTKRGDKIIMARNCHRAVYHGVLLRELQTVYIYPKIIEGFQINGGIDAKEIEELIEKNLDCKAIILTSPTYEGIVSDIEKITEIAHKFQIPVIIDEAHGAHFSVMESFPKSAIVMGADVVIQSFHKTLPALTQTGILHTKGKLVDRKKLEKALAIFQTSSPSYVFMASIDYCVGFIKNEKQKIECYSQRLENLRKKIKQLRHIQLLDEQVKWKDGVFDVDKSKILLSVCEKTITGREFYNKLREKYQLQCEMYMGSYVLLMTSVMDLEEGYERLKKAVFEIEREIKEKEEEREKKKEKTFKLETVYSIAEAEERKKERKEFEKTEGMVCADWIMVYPPGIPFAVPGERLTGEIIEQIRQYQKMGLKVQGLEEGKWIQVC